MQLNFSVARNWGRAKKASLSYSLSILVSIAASAAEHGSTQRACMTPNAPDYLLLFLFLVVPCHHCFLCISIHHLQWTWTPSMLPAYSHAGSHARNVPCPGGFHARQKKAQTDLTQACILHSQHASADGTTLSAVVGHLDCLHLLALWRVALNPSFAA